MQSFQSVPQVGYREFFQIDPTSSPAYHGQILYDNHDPFGERVQANALLLESSIALTCEHCARPSEENLYFRLSDGERHRIKSISLIDRNGVRETVESADFPRHRFRSDEDIAKNGERVALLALDTPVTNAAGVTLSQTQYSNGHLFFFRLAPSKGAIEIANCGAGTFEGELLWTDCFDKPLLTDGDSGCGIFVQDRYGFNLVALVAQRAPCQTEPNQRYGFIPISGFSVITSLESQNARL